MRPLMKRLLLGTLGAAAAIVFYARFVERARVRLDRFTVPMDKPGIPPQGLTILHLSDLHLRESGAIQARKLDSLRRALAGEQYDLVALTGDLIHDQPGLATALSFIAELRPRLGGFSCLGNHDYWESSLWGIFGKRADDAGPWRPADLIAAARKLWAFVGNVLRNERVYARVAAHDIPAMNSGLQALGVQALVNASTHLRAGEIDLWIAGVDDLGQGAPIWGKRWPMCPRARRCCCWLTIPISGWKPGSSVPTWSCRGTRMAARYACPSSARFIHRAPICRDAMPPAGSSAARRGCSLRVASGRACRCGWARRPGRADPPCPGRSAGLNSRRVDPPGSNGQRRVADRRFVAGVIGALPGRARPGGRDGAILMRPIRATTEGMQPRHLAVAVAAEKLDKGAAIACGHRTPTQAIPQATPKRIHGSIFRPSGPSRPQATFPKAFAGVGPRGATDRAALGAQPTGRFSPDRPGTAVFRLPKAWHQDAEAGIVAAASRPR